MTHIVASSQAWHESVAINIGSRISENVAFIDDSNQLTRENLNSLKAEIIFCPHWSTIIPPEIYEKYECIVFHMTDLPFGRGGSPLQNLIVRGISETKITAFRCVKELDAGPIYMKRPLSLHGTAQEIYVRAAKVVEDMVVSIIQESPGPEEQAGQVVVFQRRKRRMGILPSWQVWRECTIIFVCWTQKATQGHLLKLNVSVLNSVIPLLRVISF